MIGEMWTSEFEESHQEKNTTQELPHSCWGYNEQNNLMARMERIDPLNVGPLGQKTLPSRNTFDGAVSRNAKWLGPAVKKSRETS